MLALIMVSLVLPAGAQVTSNVLQRVLQVRSPSTVCSAFTIEIVKKQYLVTARHCVDGVTDSKHLLVRQGNDWTPIVGPIFLPSNSEVDIAAIGLAQSITSEAEFQPTSDGIVLGQPVFFIGYPYDLSTKWKPSDAANFSEIAFIKAGILSAMDSRNPQAIMLYIDGHNNPGFSGGPIVFRPSPNSPFRVAAVVKGFRGEATPVVKGENLQDPNAPAYEDLYTRANTGIVVGYSIQHIVNAINNAKKKE